MGQEQGGVLATLDRVNEPRTASQVLGRTLRGRYRVLEPISAGAMGQVYRAIDTESDTEVALKQCTNPHHDQRFEAEARLLASLQHPARRPHQGPLLVAKRPVPGDGPGPRNRPRRAAQAARPARTSRRPGDRVHAPGLRGAPVRPRPADRPPRRQAPEPDPERERRRAGGLRDRPPPRRGRGTGDGRDRDAPVHGPRGVRRRQRVGAHRRVQRRRHALDAAHGPAAGLRRPDQAFDGRARGDRPSSSARSPPDSR